MTTQRALIYTRVSLDQTGEGKSVARQEEACRSFADARGYDVVGVETDSQSAYSDRVRSGWERAKAAADRGEVDIIVGWRLDRLTRSMAELEQLIDLTERSGCSVTTVMGDLDLTTGTGRMLARILGAVARQEVETKAERQRLANQQRATEGRPFSGGPSLFGYRPDGEVIESEAEAIRQAAEDVLGGVSCYAVAKRLSKVDLLPRSTRRAGPGPWTPAGVKLMLVNPRLAGLSTYRGRVVGRGNWEPIIDEATHIQLRALLTDPTRTVGTVKAGPKASSLLSGIARCGKPDCGGTLQAGSNRGARIYACKRGHVQAPRNEADIWVTAQVVLQIARATGGGAVVIDEPGAQINSTQIDELRERQNELALSHAEGAITLAQLRIATARLQEKIDEAQSRAQVPETRKLTPEEATQMFLSASLEGQRAMIREAFEVTVHPRGRGRSIPIDKQIEVVWHEVEGSLENA